MQQSNTLTQAKQLSQSNVCTAMDLRQAGVILGRAFARVVRQQSRDQSHKREVRRNKDTMANWAPLSARHLNQSETFSRQQYNDHK
jgi:hypothetical protein